MSDLALPWPALLAMGLALASFVGVLAARWPAALAAASASAICCSSKGHSQAGVVIGWLRSVALSVP